MTSIPLLGYIGWSGGILYMLASLMFGLPFGIEVFLIGTGMMVTGLISLIVPSLRGSSIETGGSE